MILEGFSYLNDSGETSVKPTPASCCFNYPGSGGLLIPNITNSMVTASNPKGKKELQTNSKLFLWMSGKYPVVFSCPKEG